MYLFTKHYTVLNTSKRGKYGFTAFWVGATSYDSRMTVKIFINQNKIVNITLFNSGIFFKKTR